MLVKEQAKELRSKIKSKFGFTSKQVSVRSYNYSTESSIQIELKTKEALKHFKEIESLAKQYEEIRYDYYLQEILLGGNTYVEVTINHECLENDIQNILPKISTIYNQYDVTKKYDFQTIHSNGKYKIAYSKYENEVRLYKENELLQCVYVESPKKLALCLAMFQCTNNMIY